MNPQAANLLPAETPMSPNTLGHYQLKLHMIVREMELCKAALGEWKLTTHQAVTANRLIMALEKSVEELGETVSTHLSLTDDSRTTLSVDEQLENVCGICDQLMSTIFSRTQPVPMHA